MKDSILNLSRPPIVEAVLDIDCDMPPTLDLAALETKARETFHDHYPKFRSQHIQELRFDAHRGGPPEMTTRQGVQALQFLQEDEKQLVQVRAQGFSFNRLAPYGRLDDYLPEMERTWRLFVGLAAPVQVQVVRLRYINRILLPMTAGKVTLEEYLKHGPRLPDEDKLILVGFLDQHSALETDTGNHVNIILAAQPQEDDKLPVIFDIETFRVGKSEPDDWTGICSAIRSLRRLKNLVFRNSLTDRCLELFQH